MGAYIISREGSVNHDYIYSITYSDYEMIYLKGMCFLNNAKVLFPAAAAAATDKYFVGWVLNENTELEHGLGRNTKVIFVME